MEWGSEVGWIIFLLLLAVAIYPIIVILNHRIVQADGPIESLMPSNSEQLQSSPGTGIGETIRPEHENAN